MNVTTDDYFDENGEKKNDQQKNKTSTVTMKMRTKMSNIIMCPQCGCEARNEAEAARINLFGQCNICLHEEREMNGED